MSAPINITAERFGRLVAVRLISSDKQGRRWLFQCDCGAEIEARSGSVRIGKTKSCGCLQKEKAALNAVAARAAKSANAPSLEDRFWSKVEKRGDDECWLWKACVRRKDEGYGAFFLDGKHHPASRVAFILSGGELLEGQAACHSCDNPPCCNPKHVFAGTRKQNNDDKILKRRHAFGSRNGFAKLTEEQVKEIKSHRPPPGTRARVGLLQRLSHQFGVKPGTISDIWRRSWTHV